MLGNAAFHIPLLLLALSGRKPYCCQHYTCWPSPVPKVPNALPAVKDQIWIADVSQESTNPYHIHYTVQWTVKKGVKYVQKEDGEEKLKKLPNYVLFLSKQNVGIKCALLSIFHKARGR